MQPFPPGPRGPFAIGSFADLQRNILGFIAGSIRDHGDIVGFRVLGKRFCILGHPDLIDRVLIRDADRFRKSSDYRKLAGVVGRGLLTSEGDVWRRQRRLAQPIFQNERVQSYVPVFLSRTDEVLAAWNVGGEIDVHSEMMRLTLLIVAESLFHAVVAADVHTVQQALEATSIAFQGFPFPFWIPFPRHVHAWRHLAKLDRVMYRLIRERRAKGAHAAETDERRGDRPSATDLLSLLLTARDEQGRTMSDRQLRDELMTVFLAGHETTAIALAFALWLIAGHPPVEATLRAEWQRVLGEGPVTAESVARLDYTRAVVSEVLRLYPPAWFIGRETRDDYDLDGYTLPRGTTLFLCPYIVQRDARFFPHPERFDPDRWTSGAAKPPRCAYFPFGAGARSCIGAGFAMLEMTTVLPAILRRFRLIGDPTPPRLLPAITLRPADGIRMRLESCGPERA